MNPASRPDLVKRLLSLPIEARQALAEQEGPGWTIQPDGTISDIRNAPKALGFRVMSSRGWAWWPADSLAWLRAATPEGGRWGAYMNESWIFPHSGDNSDGWIENTPQEAALAAFEAKR